MRFRNVCCLSVALFLFSGVLIAQEMPQMPAAEKEHQWLKQFVGEWITQTKGTMGPGQPPMNWSGTISSQMLGEFWVINKMGVDLEGGAMHGVQTVGYDAKKKKYVGTWVDSMTSTMWQYEGTVDPTGKILTLEANGPTFDDPEKLTKYEDIYEFKSADDILVTSRMLGADGKWLVFMDGTATRKK